MYESRETKDRSCRRCGKQCDYLGSTGGGYLRDRRSNLKPDGRRSRTTMTAASLFGLLAGGMVLNVLKEEVPEEDGPNRTAEPLALFEPPRGAARNGSRRSERRRRSSSPAAHGRTATARPSKREVFYSLAEARIIVAGWRQHDNTKRPHSALGYRPPAPTAVVWTAAPAQPASPAASNVAASRQFIRFEPSHLMGQASPIAILLFPSEPDRRSSVYGETGYGDAA